MEAWIELIQQVGIAAVVAVLCMCFIKYMYDKNREDVKLQREEYTNQLETERQRHNEEMKSVTEVLNNNTVALTELTTYIKSFVSTEVTDNA
jgi:hypothetical protein